MASSHKSCNDKEDGTLLGHKDPGIKGANDEVGSCKNTAEIVDTGAIRPEGFVIRTKDNALYIVCKDATNCGFAVEVTLYGVWRVRA